MPRSRWVTAESNLRFSHQELLHGCALHDSIADPISDGRRTIRPAFTDTSHDQLEFRSYEGADFDRRTRILDDERVG